jgi:hypothetical protein
LPRENTNKPRKMGKNLYGLGFSPLSIGNKDHAFPEELMSQKETGTFAIMGSDGYMISSEYIGRTKAHIEAFAQRMVTDNTLGKIYKMTLDENLVRTVIDSDNMMANGIVIPHGKDPISSVRFNVGIEYFERATSAAIITASDIKVEIEFDVVRGTYSKTFMVNEPIDQINLLAYKIDYTDYPEKTAEDKYYLRVHKFKVILPERFNKETHTVAVHDILIGIVGGDSKW